LLIDHVIDWSCDHHVISFDEWISIKICEGTGIKYFSVEIRYDGMESGWMDTAAVKT